MEKKKVAIEIDFIGNPKLGEITETEIQQILLNMEMYQNAQQRRIHITSVNIIDERG